MAVSDNADLATRLRATLPDDFIESVESGARGLDLEEDGHILEFKMHVELLAVLQLLAHAETVWRGGLEGKTGYVRIRDWWSVADLNETSLCAAVPCGLK
jgi:hypothetical protein